MPKQYGAYLIGGPTGPVDMRQSSTLVFQSKIENLKSKIPLTLAVGLPEYLAPFLAAPLSKEHLPTTSRRFSNSIAPNATTPTPRSMSWTYRASKER